MNDDLVEPGRRRLAAERVEATPGSVARALRSEGMVLADVAVLDRDPG